MIVMLITIKGEFGLTEDQCDQLEHDVAAFLNDENGPLKEMNISSVSVHAETS